MQKVSKNLFDVEIKCRACVRRENKRCVQERLAIKEGQCEQLQAALSEERRQCSQARQQASELETNLKVIDLSCHCAVFHFAISFCYWSFVAGELRGESGVQGVWEEAGTLKSKLAEAVALQGKAHEEAGKELAAAKIAWELRRQDELQVCVLCLRPHLIASD